MDEEEYFLLRCDRARSDINIKILKKPMSSYSSRKRKYFTRRWRQCFPQKKPSFC